LDKKSDNEMKCQICQKEKIVSQILKCCLDCIRNFPEKTKKFIFNAHKISKEKFDLPYPPPKEGKIVCNLCQNRCQMGDNEISFCGLRKNEKGKLKILAGTNEAILKWYFDPLPTNCVASFVCEGSEKFGKKNLAIFYGACTFDCLFCQNWHFRFLTKNLEPKFKVEEIVKIIDKETFCVCFFGGDPTPQLPHALKLAKEAAKKGLRVCWETNGGMNENLLRKMAEISLKSKGIIKFDLKAFNENLNLALTGVSNRQTLKNFEILAKEYLPKAKGIFLVASTLLVPGYIDKKEVFDIANFISKLNPEIPYSLLGFYPHYLMKDLPLYTFKEAKECFKIAKEAGLKKVNLGNLHLFI
jgi:pyruvate formate lyase activating enzyme